MLINHQFRYCLVEYPWSYCDYTIPSKLKIRLLEIVSDGDNQVARSVSKIVSYFAYTLCISSGWRSLEFDQSDFSPFSRLVSFGRKQTNNNKFQWWLSDGVIWFEYDITMTFRSPHSCNSFRFFSVSFQFVFFLEAISIDMDFGGTETYFNRRNF